MKTDKLFSDIDNLPLNPLVSLSNESNSATSEAHGVLHSRSSEQQNSSEPHQESLSFNFHGVLSDNGVNDIEDECVKQEDNVDAPNTALATSHYSTSVEHASRLSCCSCSAGSEETRPESPAASLGTEVNHHAPGNACQWRIDNSKSIDPVDLERGSVTGNDVNSVLPQDTEKSSQEFCDQNATIPVVESSNQVEHSRTSPSPDESLHSPPPERDESTSESESQGHQLFHAFPEKRWFRSDVFAGVGFCIMTLMVLGNLIYTYNPLRPMTHL